MSPSQRPGFKHPRAPSLRLYDFLCSPCSFRPRDGICFLEVAISMISLSSLFNHLVINIFLSGFPDGSEKPPANLGDTSSIPSWRRSSGEGHGNPLQYSCLENPNGQRSLAGYSPWGHYELDTTERLHFHFSLSCTGRRKWQPTPAFLPGESQG